MSTTDPALEDLTFNGSRHSGSTAFRHIGPNWYAAVMGISIIPSAGIALPHQFPGALHIWQLLWLLTFAAFVVLVAARAIHFIFHADQARAHFMDPAMAPFYACKSIAFLAVGLVTYTVGKTVIGEQAALVIDIVLFVIGTLLGLIVAAGVMLTMILRHDLKMVGTSPVWLLPAMGPMVSAAFAGPLLAHMDAGANQQLLILGLYAMFGLDLLATMIVFPMVLQRLFLHGPLPIQATPALFLGLAPFGQAVNAVNNLGDAVVRSGLAAPYGDAFAAFALLFGVPVMGFTLLWLAVSLVMVIRAQMQGMKFSMVWWSFGFPLGTVVTGMEGITRHTGLAALSWFTVAVYLLLCFLVGATFLHTVAGLVSGKLLAAPKPAPAIAAVT
ncbi:MAG TPA: TDT family transporter [Herbaspirillum sp.]|jgi:tellurite resistance protein TehA-like permease